MSSVLLVWIGFCLYMIVRNVLVHRFLGKILQQYGEQSLRDIHSNCLSDPMWRFKEADRQLNYHQMVYKFWVWPLSRFITDPTFLAPFEEGGHRQAAWRA